MQKKALTNLNPWHKIKLTLETKLFWLLGHFITQQMHSAAYYLLIFIEIQNQLARLN